MTSAREGRVPRSLRFLLPLFAGAALASLAFAAVSQGGPTAARGFTACKDGRGYLYVPSGPGCPVGADVVWSGEIPAVAQGAKSLTKDAVVQRYTENRFGETVKDPGGWKRTKRYVAKCPLEYVAVGGSFTVEWVDVYGVDIVASRPRILQGVSAWEVYAVSEDATNKAPGAEVSVSAICIARTAIFPSG